MTIKELKKSIIKTTKQCISDNFVGAAVELDKDGQAVHSGIVIFYKNNYRLFHYDAKNVSLLESNDPNWKSKDWYFHKTIESISEYEIEAFLGWCRDIKLNSSPRYAFYYDGLSKYDISGKFISPTVKGEFMTCVGFCLNVINGFIEDESYLDSTTWPITEETEQDRFEDFIEDLRKQNIKFDLNVIKLGFKRITPSEYLSSAFLSKKPILYNELYPINQNVEYVLCELVNN